MSRWQSPAVELDICTLSSWSKSNADERCLSWKCGGLPECTGRWRPDLEDGLSRPARPRTSRAAGSMRVQNSQPVTMPRALCDNGAKTSIALMTCSARFASHPAHLSCSRPSQRFNKHAAADNAHAHACQRTSCRQSSGSDLVHPRSLLNHPLSVRCTSLQINDLGAQTPIPTQPAAKCPSQ